MSLSKEELAAKGEQLATELLQSKGYEILERNYRYGHGEIDIIAKDPGTDYTVFVEVNSRQNLNYGEPEYAITKSKQRQIKKIAELYMYDKEMEELSCRFDVVAVMLNDINNPELNHYENAFM